MERERRERSREWKMMRFSVRRADRSCRSDSDPRDSNRKR